jgi:hypothetical protein
MLSFFFFVITIIVIDDGDILFPVWFLLLVHVLGLCQAIMHFTPKKVALDLHS